MEECKGVYEEGKIHFDGLVPVVIVLMITDLIKICIFNYSLSRNFTERIFCNKIKLSINSLLITFMFVNFLLFSACYSLIIGENNCQLYLTNFVTFDMVCSYLAVINMWRETNQLELRYNFIAKSFLESYYLEEKNCLIAAIAGKEPTAIINENRIVEKMVHQLEVSSSTFKDKA